jgi:hypothetical protein
MPLWRWRDFPLFAKYLFVNILQANTSRRTACWENSREARREVSSGGFRRWLVGRRWRQSTNNTYYVNLRKYAAAKPELGSKKEARPTMFPEPGFREETQPMRKL